MPPFSHPAQVSNLGQAEACNPLLPPYTQRVSTTFRTLKIQLQEITNASHQYSSAELRLIKQFWLTLNVESLGFDNTITDLIDDDRSLDENDWSNVEPTVARRCGSHYGRYLDAVDQISGCLKEIALLLDLCHHEALYPEVSEPLEVEIPVASIPVTQLLASEVRWAKFIAALCTVNGALGGMLEIQLSRIRNAIDNLRKIRHLSEKALTPTLIQRLEVLRKKVKTAAHVLGTENGFDCPCQGSHKAFLRVKECFNAYESEHATFLMDNTCALVLYNSSPPNSSQWNWAEFRVGTRDKNDIPQAQPPAKSHTPPKNSEIGQKPSSGWLKSALKKRKSSKDPDKPKFVCFPTPIGDGLSSGYRGSVENESSSMKNKNTVNAALAAISTEPSMGLCNFVATCCHGSSDVDSSTSEPQGTLITLARHDVELRLNVDHHATSSAVSWANALSIRDQFLSAKRFGLSTEQKLQLAYKVASSLFYLYSTPWLEDSWNGDDVYLPRRSDGSVLIDPLLSKRHIRNRSSTDTFDTKELGHFVPPIITRLGRFLIELCCGASWNYIRKAFPDSSAPALASDKDLVIFSNFLSWVEDPQVAPRDKPCHLEGRSYFEAIRNCFSGDFAHRLSAPSMDDDEFRIGVYEHILRPLKLALEDFQIQQTQIFGPPIVISQESVMPATIKGQKYFELFDDEEVKGDTATVKKKYAYADTWFKNFEFVQGIARTVSPRRPESPDNRIRVAILDTGVDVTHDLLRGPWRRRQLIYRDFVGSEADIPRDDHGHGTHVTSILLKVAPNVDVYVARVSGDGKAWDSSQVTEAIQWAVRDKEVHIISLSFGFPNVDQSLEPIRQAILEAHAADVLVFAATGNKGKGHPISFPACLDEVISVGSTDGNAVTSEFVPVLGPGKRLCAIGEAIEAAWICPSEDAHATTVRRAGTSYATPVAAGVAAMVMDFIWADRTKDTNKDRYEYKTLRTKRGMLAVLGLMLMREERESVECLSPWKLFEESQAQPISGSRCGILDIILGRLRTVYSKTG